MRKSGEPLYDGYGTIRVIGYLATQQSHHLDTDNRPRRSTVRYPLMILKGSLRDGTSSSVEGQYRGTSHATTTSTFSALNNPQIPSRDRRLDAAEKGGNQRRDRGEIYHQSRGLRTGSDPPHHVHIYPRHHVHISTTQQSTNRAHPHPNRNPNHQPRHSIDTITPTCITLPMIWVEVLSHTCHSK